ncbi:MAG: phosphoserine phosphatase SerB [Alphaproteobacteria bacterium]|nr:phosphoserine phosphatase SerB [Alphaproteobacteria bacterium]
MSLVLSLLVDPARPILDRRLVDRARKAAGEAGDPAWLAPGAACDIAVGSDADLAVIRQALGDAPVDANLIPATARRKRLLIADMDSTVVTTETLDEIAAHAGLKEVIAAITRRSMNGEIDFPTALRERVAMLRGLAVDALGKTLEQTELTSGARTLVQTMKTHGAFTALVSGGFTYFTSAIGRRCGFDLDRSNVLGTADGALTGELVGPILDRTAKLDSLKELSAARGLTLADTIAVGDGANDLDMLGAAGFGVAFHAKPAVNAETRIQVRHSDLTALLYLQGYRRDELVGG